MHGAIVARAPRVVHRTMVRAARARVAQARRVLRATTRAAERGQNRASILAKTGPLRSAQAVERPLQDVGGGHLVDHARALAAREIGVEHRALGRDGGQALIPEGDRQCQPLGKPCAAVSRADWARGPSLPSMLTGRPTTMPPMPSAAVIARRVSISRESLVRRSVVRAVAMVRFTSETAIPMVFVPRSSPMRRASAASKPFSSFRSQIAIACPAPR